MELKDCIGEYRNFLSLEQVSTFLKIFSKYEKFGTSSVLNDNGGSRVDKKIRDVKQYSLNILNNFTETQWYNYITSKVSAASQYYMKDKKLTFNLRAILELSLLKYTEGGFYKVHTDSAEQIYRELSVIIFLNNDYEGGELVFTTPNRQEEILTIKPEPGKIIIWPSNSLFPHGVKPVIKGTRFVLVSWIK